MLCGRSQRHKVERCRSVQSQAARNKGTPSERIYRVMTQQRNTATCLPRYFVRVP